MYMAYSKNPHLPRVRMDAVKLVRQGWSYRKVARHTGFSIGSISSWVQKAEPLGRSLWIPTQSSRPHHHPRQLPRRLVQAIVQERMRHGRCAEVVHQQLLRQAVVVSLSSVKRTLERQNLVKKHSPWKKLHRSLPRPWVQHPGDLVEVDTIHFWEPQRFYVYTLLDVCTRWAWAQVSRHATTKHSLWFVRAAQAEAPFQFEMLQSDHGSEFSANFSRRVGVEHRHSRVRQPNDNAHVERFNRTLQEECFGQTTPQPRRYGALLADYLPYYNDERLHMGLEFHTPAEVFRRF